MKKLLTPLVLLVLVCIGFESNGQTRAGLGLVYGTEVEEAGINFNGEYGITDNISANANITIFFVEDLPGADFGYWTLNLDGHYYFQGGLSGAYALAGLNVSTATIDTPTNDNSTSFVSSESQALCSLSIVWDL